MVNDQRLDFYLSFVVNRCQLTCGRHWERARNHARSGEGRHRVPMVRIATYRILPIRDIETLDDLLHALGAYHRQGHTRWN